MTREVISFKTSEPLLELLSSNINRLSLLEDQHGGCEQLILWFSDEHGVAIWSEMHDVADRLEVGVLTFKRVYDEPKSSSIAFPRPGTPLSIPLLVPESPSEIWNLTINEGDFTCESGLRIVFPEGDEIVILPSGRPYFLSVHARQLQLESSEPEYPVTAYEQTRVF